MKKLFVITSTVTALLASSVSFAKTQGSYLGMDAIGTQTTFYERQNTTSHTYSVNVSPSNAHTSYGFGLNYKYAINLNNFFIAPGLILEQNGVGGSSNDGEALVRLQARNRYGIKADFGYDLTNAIAPYLTVGYAEVSYKTRVSGLDASNNLVTAVRNGRDSGWFGGAGIKFDIGNNFTINAEYNYQRFTAKTSIPSQSTDYINSISYKSRLDIAKVGLSYNF